MRWNLKRCFLPFSCPFLNGDHICIIPDGCSIFKDLQKRRSCHLLSNPFPQLLFLSARTLVF